MISQKFVSTRKPTPVLGSRILQLDNDSDFQVAERINQGLSPDALKHLAEHLELTVNDMLVFTEIMSSTYRISKAKYRYGHRVQDRVASLHRQGVKMKSMTLTLDLPAEVVEALGPQPEQEALEVLLLHLVQQGRVTLAWAGERLGMNRWQAIEWYTSHGFSYPDYREEDLEHDLKYAESRLGRS